MAQAGNVTKFAAGGSGNNYIPDGYIRAVEKLWIDSYTIAFTNTNTTIDIAIIPPNKKIIGIEFVLLTSLTQTNGTISVGFSTDASIDTFLPATTITHNQTITGIVLNSIGLLMFGASGTPTSATIVTQVPMRQAAYQLALGSNPSSETRTTISVKLNNWTMTTGTLYSIVRYT